MGVTGENAGRITHHRDQVQRDHEGCARGLACNPDDTGELGGVFKHQHEYLGSRKKTEEVPWGMARWGQRLEFQSPGGSPQQSHQRNCRAA